LIHRTVQYSGLPFKLPDYLDSSVRAHFSMALPTSINVDNPDLTTQNAFPDLSSGTIADLAIVAVMGTTGSGKSTFIQKATGTQDVVVGHTYAACKSS
jgi:translation initiation factor RLI1